MRQEKDDRRQEYGKQNEIKNKIKNKIKENVLGGPGSFGLPGMSMKKLCNFKYALETKVPLPFRIMYLEYKKEL